MNQSSELKELITSLVRFQSTVEGARKDSTNPHFKSKYADLESVWEVSRELLGVNGLAVSQWPDTIDGKPALTTMLMHVSGQYITRTVPLVLAKQDPQAMGSAITYQRRYSMSAILGLIQVDDDANDAMPPRPESRVLPPTSGPINAARSADAFFNGPQPVMVGRNNLPPVQAGMFDQPPADDVDPPVCVCGNSLRKTQRGDAWACVNYKNPLPGGQRHTYLPV